MPMWYETTARSSEPKRARGLLEVADRAGERRLGIEALVDARALGREALRALGLAELVGAVDLLRQPPARARGRPASRAGRSPSRRRSGSVPRRPRGRRPAITCERPALSRKTIASSTSGSTSRARGRALDLVAVARDQPRRRDRAAGAVGVEDVRDPGGGAGLELAAARGLVGERVLVERRPREVDGRTARVAGRDQRRRERHGERDHRAQRREPRASGPAEASPVPCSVIGSG